MIKCWWLPFLCILSLNCSKDNLTQIVEIYLLSSYKMVSGKCQIDSSTAILQATAIDKNEDIVTYSPSFYQFQLTNASFQTIKNLRDFTPFAVTISKRVIYYGFFKPSFSSSSCD